MMMSEFLAQHQAAIAAATMAVVLICIVFDILDLAVAAMLGSVVYAMTGILTRDDVPRILDQGGAPLALLFGGMVVARTLVPTGIFDWMGTQLVRLSSGRGSRLMIGIALLTAPLCVFLPSTTVVILLTPVVIDAARRLEMDFVPVVILMVIIANSAGLLTFVGDAAAFTVGSSVGMTYASYLANLSPGGILTLLVPLAAMPLLFARSWRFRSSAPEAAPGGLSIRRPMFLIVALCILIVMVALFMVGDALPAPVGPPAAAILGASCALLAIYKARFESVADVIRDVDWKTLIFVTGMFFMVGGLVNSGALQGLYLFMANGFGSDLLLAALVLLVAIAAASSLVPNLPLVVGMILMVKGYLVVVGVLPEEALSTTFTAWPEAIVPVFGAMMFGATLGGNATLIGASANVAAAGICAREGRVISFMGFLRYGLPIAVVQILVAAAYVVAISAVGEPAAGAAAVTPN